MQSVHPVPCHCEARSSGLSVLNPARISLGPKAGCTNRPNGLRFPSPARAASLGRFTLGERGSRGWARYPSRCTKRVTLESKPLAWAKTNGSKPSECQRCTNTITSSIRAASSTLAAIKPGISMLGMRCLVIWWTRKRRGDALRKSRAGINVPKKRIVLSFVEMGTKRISGRVGVFKVIFPVAAGWLCTDPARGSQSARSVRPTAPGRYGPAPCAATPAG